MMQKKYGYTGHIIKWHGKEFKQIVALRDVSSTVHKGDIGGYVEGRDILSHAGRCWIDSDCVVGGDVTICDNAKLSGSFVVLQEGQHLRIEGCSRVTGTEFDCDNGVIIDSYVTNSTLDGRINIMNSEVLRSDLKNVASTGSNIIDCALVDSAVIDTLYLHNRKR